MADLFKDSLLQPTNQMPTPDARAFCYSCHKPAAHCLCSLTKPCDNRCGITILQHPRERHHPIGTARLVRLALRQARIEVCWRLAAPQSLRIEATARWGILFPSPHALDLSIFATSSTPPPQDGPAILSAESEALLTPAVRPEHLIVLDGTWAHARSLYRHNRWLWKLPHYCITPKGHDRYRIRREPKAEYTSTLEAIVTALTHLEPQTEGLTEIMAAFDCMIDRQIACIQTLQQGARRRLRPRSSSQSRGVPKALVERPEKTIVVFAEFMQRTNADKTWREMVYLTAQHQQSGRCFAQFVQSQSPGPSERHLEHMQLHAAEITANAVEFSVLAEQWRIFAGLCPQLVAWNQASLELVLPLCCASTPNWLLKTIFAAAHRQRGGSLQDAVQRAHLDVTPANVRGRASMRLAAAAAVAKYLVARAEDKAADTQGFKSPHARP